MIEIYADYETPSNAGADGLFQIISVTYIDEFGNEKDLTSKVDQGKFYRGGKAVLKDLNLDPDKVDFEITT